MSTKNNAPALRQELLQGILIKWYKYLPLLLITTGFCIALYLSTQFIATARGIEITPSAMDYLLYLFAGMPVYIPGPDNPFQIPYIWMTINLYIAFMTAHYPTRDLSGFGKHILLRSGTRTGWYLRKCLWVFVNVLVCYLMIYAVAAGLSLVTGNVSFTASPLPMGEWLGADYSTADYAALLRTVLLLPLLTSLALSLCQMVFEFLLRPIFGFTIIACLLMVSAYLYTPVMIGNFSILLRSEFAMGEEGLQFWPGVIVNTFLIVAAVVIGCLYFRRTDILDKN